MRKLLWAVLFSSLLAMLPLISLRVSNEAGNRSVLIAGSLEDFAPGTPAQGVFPVSPGRLRAAGLSGIIVDEASLEPDSLTAAGASDRLEELHEAGLEIVLRVRELNPSGEFCGQLEAAIERWGIKYLLAYPEFPDTAGASLRKGSPAPDAGDAEKEKSSFSLAQLVVKHDMTVFLMENEEQSGLYPLPGLDRFIPKTGYRINRAFSICTSLLKSTDAENAVHVWRRAVIDRSIRLVAVGSHDLQLSKESFAAENFVSKDFVSESLSAVSKLRSDLAQRGFLPGAPVKTPNASIPGPAAKIPIFINLFAALALYLSYLIPGEKTGSRSRLTYAACLTAFAVPFFFVILQKQDIGAAFTAAVIYPSFSSLLLLKYLERHTGRGSSLLRNLSAALALTLSFSLAAAAAILAAMADVRYTMHLINFNPVDSAYLLPLLLFPANLALHRGIPARPRQAIPRITPVHIGLVLFLAAFLFLYLQRNGNSPLFLAPVPELEARKFLETFLYARPRTKEFLIGYPALFLFVRTYHFFRMDDHSAVKGLSFLSGLLATVTGISIANSFCHGFTPAAVSLARTAEGCAAGILTGSAVLLLFAFFTKKQSPGKNSCLKKI